MLAFLEKIAGAQDHLVGKVCDCTVVEEALRELTMPEIYSMLGPQAKASVNYVGQFMNL